MLVISWFIPDDIVSSIILLTDSSTSRLHHMVRSWPRSDGCSHQGCSSSKQAGWRIQDSKGIRRVDIVKNPSLPPSWIVFYVQVISSYYISKRKNYTSTRNFSFTYKNRFFSARKHGLVEAAARNNLSDMTAIVAFPGGIGTLDELFEILALIQLERIGSKFQVPFLLMNYDSFYSKLLEFLDDCRKMGTVSSGEVESLWKVCSGNPEALEYLAAFYGHPQRIEQWDLGQEKISSARIGILKTFYLQRLNKHCFSEFMDLHVCSTHLHCIHGLLSLEVGWKHPSSWLLYRNLLESSKANWWAPCVQFWRR